MIHEKIQKEEIFEDQDGGTSYEVCFRLYLSLKYNLALGFRSVLDKYSWDSKRLLRRMKISV